ncbi:serine/threonine protein kinase [Microtetraspora sp. NBRC 13810]|uniref:tetratricopeptide repeat protein n=1 Tax=Microtetraspora sp. NBRC 13810 TaxID=3030990 RepID=UPI0024A435C9|nr:tetratricopeptide repeat protein [Microtetraspora sp. NBRC 13810]GLW09565.1 serine/threonine protein kinase [Microtetraspora sp. NBRC 13810]
MTKCAHPGCTGTVQDGYCDSCGLAPPVAAPVSAPPPPAPPPASAPVSAAHAFAPAPPVPGGPGASGGTQGGVPGTGWRAQPAGWRPATSSGRAAYDPGTSPGTAPGTAPATGPTSGPASGRSTSSTRSRRGLLGAGLVAVPPVPYRDPSEVVLHNPEVPEDKRFCSNGSCGKPVGRSKNDRPGRTEGFCPHCGTRFSFTPKLRPGDLVAGQYEVKGCLAHGGLGWIYLAADLNLDGRWVVLKGLLDTGDVEALLAAEAERRFLTGVDHANIVRIFNFVQHPDPATMTMVGYIVMEYVGGRPLQEMLRARLRATANREALPIGQAIAYILEVLRAFDYLHDRGLLYCDLKPANVIQVEDQLKLIDLGAVRHVDDQESAIYGTIGYQAPEIAAEGPSVVSDLYTVGRMLAVLSFPFSPVTGGVPTPLPPPGQVPVLAYYESLYRFLQRATDPVPARRFPSAAEMAEQLTGILREIRAAEDGIPYPAPSAQFGPERVAAGTALAEGDTPAAATGTALAPHAGTAPHGGTAPHVGTAPHGGMASHAGMAPHVGMAPHAGTAPHGGMAPNGGAARNGSGARDGLVLVPLDPAAAVGALPTPLVDPADPAAGYLAGMTARTLDDLVRLIEAAPTPTVETRLALVRALVEQRNPRVNAVLQEVAGQAPWDWRVLWYHGLRDLAWGNLADAIRVFDDLYYRMPGEFAPRLALAFSRECAGDPREAARHYTVIWRTDRSYVSAAFGLARARLAEGDRKAATRVLDEVPTTSSHHVSAQMAAVAAAVRGEAAAGGHVDELVGAGERLSDLGLDAVRHGRLAAEVLEAALAWLAAGGRSQQRTKLLGRPLTERGVRAELERVYRSLARASTIRPERHALVDKANLVRPRTWV